MGIKKYENMSCNVPNMGVLLKSDYGTPQSTTEIISKTN
jgi:hypothetical protein